MTKRPGKILEFFLPKEARIENSLSTVNESDNEALSILNQEDNLSQSEKSEQVTIDSVLTDSTTANSKFDIGLYVTGNIPVEKEFRLEILFNCWIPPENYKFPPIIQGGRNRYFNIKWLISYKWLAYSEILSGAFCKICVLFLDRNDKRVGKGGSQKVGSLVTTAFTNYKCAIEIFNKHSQLTYHIDCCVDCETFKRMAETPGLDIQDQLHQQRIEQKRLNRQRLVPIIETILFLGRQELSFRGHRGESRQLDIEEPKENDGNFRAALRLRLRAGDIVLKHHLDSSASNSKYLSPMIQNEIINISGTLICQRIVSEVQKSVPFSILADESADVSAHEQLSISVRYVFRNDRSVFLKEMFLGFITVTDLTGEGIANSIISFCISTGLDLNNLVGLGLDGASAMSGKYKGVQACIREKYPVVHYTHCSSHSLNLAIGKANNAVLGNVFSNLSSIIPFFHGYPLREEKLRQAIQAVCPESKRQRLKTICATRWVERHDAMLVFMELIEAVVACLEELTLVPGETGSKANQLVHVCTSFDFIYSCTVLENPSALFLTISKQLQSPTKDLAEICSLIENVVSILEKEMNQDSAIKRVYTKAKSISETFGSSVTLPRAHARNNPEFVGKEELFYRKRVFIPYYQWLIEQMNLRFLNHKQKVFTLQKLLPSQGGKMPLDELQKVIEPMHSLMPFSFSEIEAQMKIWEQIWIEKKRKGEPIPENAIDSLSLVHYNKDLIPAIFRILQIFSTIPITTATSERSFSTLKRIKTYLRNSMGEERLTGLALISVHGREIQLESEEIINEMSKSNRKIDFVLL